MTGKPETGAGYSSGQLVRVRETCLYMATKLGDLLDDIVIVGGLAPYLLVDQGALPQGVEPQGVEPHAGTMDLDMGLALALMNEERYRELSARLRDAGFAPDVNAEGNSTLQRWVGGTRDPVTVDFLIPAGEGADGGELVHIERDLAAVETPDLELAFNDRVWKELSETVRSGAHATRSVPVCGAGAFTMLKALAFGNRAENKVAYDLFYLWRGVGVPDVARTMQSLLPDANVRAALDVIARDFGSMDGPGPVAAAQFMTGALY
ncbi:MAG: hypothetical protein OXC99_02960 [Chloroflexi bacterium]|nr:hypothetical protein [Chloroflexota bacterium]